MAATKNVASPAVAVLVLLALVMLLSSPTALSARHLPVTTTSHRSLINLTPSPFRRPPVVSHPTPPPPPHTAVDADEFSALRKVPRGPGHSPNDPSPPPPRSAATAEKLSLLPATEQASPDLPVTTSHIALIPPYAHGRPVISHPPPPPPTSAADDEVSVLRKVPRGPGHSPNDPSPPPPLLYFPPIHAPEPPPAARKQE